MQQVFIVFIIFIAGNVINVVLARTRPSFRVSSKLIIRVSKSYLLTRCFGANRIKKFSSSHTLRALLFTIFIKITAQVNTSYKNLPISAVYKISRFDV